MIWIKDHWYSGICLVYSPRMWRWSQKDSDWLALRQVFSTYVEVILTAVLPPNCPRSILHVCGGDPIVLILRDAKCLYSPRMWRWSYHREYSVSTKKVFSTYVEVIPKWTFYLILVIRILHVCGGDPVLPVQHRFGVAYSPRMWRWSPSLGTSS